MPRASPAALADLTAPAGASGIQASVSVEGAETATDERAALVWRVAQEAVRNALRHSAASTLAVTVRGDGRRLTLEVVDDGVGFDPARVRDSEHFGLRGLRSLVAEAGGTLEVRSSPHEGTTVRMEVDAAVTGDPASDGQGVIRVVVVDDHAVIRAGLQQLLAGTPDIEVVGQAENGREALDVVRRLRPDVVLMDLQMPERRRGGRHPDDHGRGASASTSSSSRRTPTARGSSGRWTREPWGTSSRTPTPTTCCRASARSARGGSPIHPRAARTLLGIRAGSSQVQLTSRETEILRLVREGLANKQIARRLDISERTVKAHLTSAFARIGVSDRTQAAVWAERNGL